MRRISAPLEASGVGDAPAVAVDAGTRINSQSVAGSRTAPETNPLKPEFSEMRQTRKLSGACVTGKAAFVRLHLVKSNYDVCFTPARPPARLSLSRPGS